MKSIKKFFNRNQVDPNQAPDESQTRFSRSDSLGKRESPRNSFSEMKGSPVDGRKNSAGDAAQRRNSAEDAPRTIKSTLNAATEFLEPRTAKKNESDRVNKQAIAEMTGVLLMFGHLESTNPVVATRVDEIAGAIHATPKHRRPEKNKVLPEREASAPKTDLLALTLVRMKKVLPQVAGRYTGAAKTREGYFVRFQEVAGAALAKMDDDLSAKGKTLDLVPLYQNILQLASRFRAASLSRHDSVVGGTDTARHLEVLAAAISAHIDAQVSRLAQERAPHFQQPLEPVIPLGSPPRALDLLPALRRHGMHLLRGYESQEGNPVRGHHFFAAWLLYVDGLMEKQFPESKSVVGRTAYTAIDVLALMHDLESETIAELLHSFLPEELGMIRNAMPTRMVDEKVRFAFLKAVQTEERRRDDYAATHAPKKTAVSPASFGADHAGSGIAASMMRAAARYTAALEQDEAVDDIAASALRELEAAGEALNVLSKSQRAELDAALSVLGLSLPSNQGRYSRAVSPRQADHSSVQSQSATARDLLPDFPEPGLAKPTLSVPSPSDQPLGPTFASPRTLPRNPKDFKFTSPTVQARGRPLSGEVSAQADAGPPPLPSSEVPELPQKPLPEIAEPNPDGAPD